MGYSTPFTAVAGTAWKAADWNTYGRDNIAWMATDSPACRVYKSGVSAIATATDTSIQFDQERFDNSGAHSTSVNTERITALAGAGGKWLFGGLAEYASNATGSRGCHIRLNGTTYIAKMVLGAATGAGDTSSLTVTSSYALSAADYVEMRVYQSSGGGLNVVSAGNYSPEFWGYWLRT